ncbi:MAG: helix-turn-helix transcriptional regulator [Lachnospiraceae bacterium]|nr:helix-turn-helix transcriptional regulator [Lachnospiraceae bacterium]
MGIGVKLSRLMKERNTNANELALKANVPAQTIYSLIRRDATKVDIDSLIRIARALDVTAEYFCSDELHDAPAVIAAHFNGDEYTTEELDRIKEFAAFVKATRKPYSTAANGNITPVVPAEPLVNAAHARTDIEVTEEMKQHDEDIMNDPKNWE